MDIKETCEYLISQIENGWERGHYWCWYVRQRQEFTLCYSLNSLLYGDEISIATWEYFRNKLQALKVDGVYPITKSGYMAPTTRKGADIRIEFLRKIIEEVNG